LALAVEQAAEAVYMLDPDGVIEYVNAFCAIFGFPPGGHPLAGAMFPVRINVRLGGMVSL
jgi:PAS domain-containing protein